MITGHVTVLRDGKVVDEMTPAKWFFNKHEDEPTTEVAIRRAPGEDLYVVLARYDASTQTATYAVTINPLVNWIWFGFGVMALGTGLALLPETVVRLRGLEACPPRRRDDHAAAAPAAAGRCRRPLRAQDDGDASRPSPAERARAAARGGDHVHVRLPRDRWPTAACRTARGTRRRPRSCVST